MSLIDIPSTTITLAEFLGPDKKYKTEADVANALVEKDNFIERLKREAEEARQAARAAPVNDKSQEILDRLEALAKPPATERPAPSVTERVEAPKGLSESDIERVLAEREKRLKAAANINAAKADLKAKFGDKYSEVLTTVAKSNGLEVDDLETIAAKSPAALMKLFGEIKPETPFVPPASSGQGDFTPSGAAHQKKSYYDKLKTTNRNEYFSTRVQNQMYKDAMALKEEFHDVP